MTNIDDIAVLTSENVRLNYTLAGMGSRIAAFLLDTVIIVLLFTTVTMIFMSIDPNVASLEQIESEGISLLRALYYFISFGILWGYYFLFEWLNMGQTPGKQLTGIRVATSEGAPVTVMHCAVRNLLRAIDMGLAVFGLTFFIMIFTPRYQRLGDLVAGTVVVKRRRLSYDELLNAARAADQAASFAMDQAAKKSAAAPSGVFGQSVDGLRIRIDESEQLLIEKFMQRRFTLPPDVRANLARDLASRIRSRMPGDTLGQMPDEAVLEAALAANVRPGVKLNSG